MSKRNIHAKFLINQNEEYRFSDSRLGFLTILLIDEFFLTDHYLRDSFITNFVKMFKIYQ